MLIELTMGKVTGSCTITCHVIVIISQELTIIIICSELAVINSYFMNNRVETKRNTLKPI